MATSKKAGIIGAAAGGCALAAAAGVCLAAPAWWAEKGAVSGTASPKAVANLGQAKNMAELAHAKMQETLPGGAGFALDELFPARPPGPSETGYVQATHDAYVALQYKVLNLGQLKYLAEPFYGRLLSLGYDTGAALAADGFPAGWSHPYPWDPGSAASGNYAPATVGQLKAAFSFDIDAAATADAAYSPVAWKDHVGTAAAYPAGSGSELEKTGGVADTWDSDAVGSRLLYGDGAVRCKASATNTYMVFGLSSDNSSSSYSTVDHSIYFFAGTAKAFEGSTEKATSGTYTTSDVFEVRRVGTTVTYLKNGTVFYTSLTSASGSLIVDTSLYTSGAKLVGCECRGFSHATDDSDGDGLTDGWEHAGGLDPGAYNPPAADKDGDGYTDFEEYAAGTNPDSNTEYPGSATGAFALHTPLE